MQSMKIKSLLIYRNHISLMQLKHAHTNILHILEVMINWWLWEFNVEWKKNIQMHIIFQNIPCHILTYLSIVFSLCKQVLLHKMQDDKIAVQKREKICVFVQVLSLMFDKCNKQIALESIVSTSNFYNLA